MTAYCFIARSCLVLSILSAIRAMDSQERTLIRTLSIMPLANPLWQAVEQNDQHRAQELLPAYFPSALDCQYALYKAAITAEMRQLILKTIEECWFTTIELYPESKLTSFMFNYRQLISKKSFPQGVIERPFMCMLSRLKERVMVIKAIAQSPKLLKLANLMPHDADPGTLKEISARSAARIIFEQNLDVNSELENIAFDVRDLVVIYYRELQNEQTMTFKSVL